MSWFGNAETVRLELFAGTYLLKHHARPWPGIEYRQVGRLAAALGFAQQRSRVDLAIVGQIQRNMPRSAKQRMLGQLAVQAAGGEALLGGRKRPACFTQFAAQRGACEAFRCDHEK
ncbi:hypothetical protein D3C77_592910 [compost metagenome]